MAIRLANPDDDRTIADLWNAVWPSRPTGPEELDRDRNTLADEQQAQYLLAEDATGSLGLALVAHDLGSYDPLRWVIEVAVLSAARGRGTGAGLYERALASVVAQGATAIQTTIAENDPVARSFAVNRGYREAKRDFLSVLDLGSMPDVSPLPLGGQVVPFARVDSPDIRRRLHALFEAVRVDIPRVSPPTPLTFAFFEEQVLGDPSFDADLSVLAFQGELLVGMSTVYRGNEAGRLEQGLTAVLRSARGQGLARAMKVAVIRAATEQGYAAIATDNDSRNAPMLAINSALGFEPREALVTLVRDLPDG